jgi:hypothetical protein
VVGKDGATGALARSSLPYADWGVTENRKAFKNQLWRAIPGDAQYSLEYVRRAEATASDYAEVVRLCCLLMPREPTGISQGCRPEVPE